eukprot:1182809-Prorocentrum_minimum.AAC.5
MIEQARRAVGSHAGVSKKLAAFLDGDDVSVVSSKMSRLTTNTNVGYWKKGPKSVAASEYPTTAVTSRVGERSTLAIVLDMHRQFNG